MYVLNYDNSEFNYFKDLVKYCGEKHCSIKWNFKNEDYMKTTLTWTPLEMSTGVSKSIAGVAGKIICVLGVSVNSECDQLAINSGSRNLRAIYTPVGSTITGTSTFYVLSFLIGVSILSPMLKTASTNAISSLDSVGDPCSPIGLPLVLNFSVASAVISNNISITVFYDLI